MNNYIEFVHEKDRNLGIIRLNNPPENYIKTPDFLDINEIDSFVQENALKGLIITGTGRHFSAGADRDELKILSKDKELLFNKITKGKEILDFFENIEIPVISAIKGVCFGGGLEIALAAHIRVVSDKSIFSFPESGLNMIPGLSGIIRLSKIVKTGKSLEILLSGNTFSAEDAYEYGIADYITTKDEVMPFSIDLLHKMTEDRSLTVINAVVRSLNNAKKMNLRDAIEAETKVFCELALKESSLQ